MSSSSSPLPPSSPARNAPLPELHSPCKRQMLIVAAVALALITIVGIIWCATPLKPSFVYSNLTTFGVATGIAGLFTIVLLYKCFRKHEEAHYPIPPQTPPPSPVSDSGSEPNIDDVAPASPRIDLPRVEEPQSQAISPPFLQSSCSFPLMDSPGVEGSQPRVISPPLSPSPPPEVAQPAASAAAPVSTENSTSLSIRLRVIEIFDAALMDLQLAEFIVRKFFPENAFIELINDKDDQGTDIYTVKLKRNSGPILKETTVDNQDPDFDSVPIEGLVGKLGEVDKTASCNLSHAYVVLGSEIKVKIDDNKILFLNKRGEQKNTTNHGDAHEMNFTFYLSGKSIISGNPLARAIIGEDDYATLAPVSISYDHEHDRIDMLNITDFSTYIPTATGSFRREINKPDANLQRKATFMRTFETLKFAPCIGGNKPTSANINPSCCSYFEK